MGGRVSKELSRKYARAYRQSAKGKAQAAAYAKEYHKRPEAMAKAKVRRDRPEAKAKVRAYMSEYRQRPESKAKRNARLRRDALRRYGMSEAQFETMLKTQGGKCAICGTDQYNNRGPQIDHDHASGKVRGILCNACNGGMGLFKDNIAIMEAAICYLKKHTCVPRVHNSSPFESSGAM